ncbi:hypothetical protein XENOCAPTIV_017461, partial [Xenoophorus captivus]
QAGLTVGDKLVEVNGVSLESITMSSAVKVLTGNNRLRMVVRRVGKIPGIRYSKEKTTWLDPGGLAEQHGIKMGDQILAANGVSFEDITHSNAVEVLKSHTHIMLTIRGSDSNSSVSSLSSSTPVSSLSGLSQVLFPPVFRSEMVDVAISTADRPQHQSSAERTADTAMQTDPPASDFMEHPSPNRMGSDQLVGTETSRTVGETVLLKDTVVRGKGEGPRDTGGARGGRVRTLSAGDRDAEKRSPKTEALMALSKPRKPIRRSQSHITVSGFSHPWVSCGMTIAQLFSSPRESRAGSPLPHHETLQHVEDIMLIPTAALGRFDSLVMPFELEAYDILKSRSSKQKHWDFYCDYLSIDYRGGFHLQPVHDTQQERQLIEDFEKLRLASQHSGYLPPSRAFTPLLDVPVDNYASPTARSRTPSPSPSHSVLLTGSPYSTQRGHQPHRSTNRRENGTPRYDQASLLSVSDHGDAAPERGRSPVRNIQGRGRREGSPDSIYGRQSSQGSYTEVSVWVPSQQRGRTPLAHVFDSHIERSPSSGRGSGLQVNGHVQNGQERREHLPTEEYEITTLTISKAKQSLGKYNLCYRSIKIIAVQHLKSI